MAIMVKSICVLLTMFSYKGYSIPSSISRESRSWEKEACAEAKKRTNKERYTCTAAGKIQCLDGWIGDLCQVPVCGNECDPQHGYCVQPGECKCNLGYQGPSCRDCIKLPGCLHGDCSKSFTCNCEPGWSGMFCNNPECDADCVTNNGVCVAPGECTCQPGYQGDTCDTCAPPPGCLHGSCTQPLECQCEEGWQGALCDTPVCSDTCSADHGTCDTPDTCLCKLGYQGDTCDQCISYPGCVNGVCDEPYDCHCLPGWTGELCDIPEVQIFGMQPREGRCQPLEAFKCFNGGVDICVYDGHGVRVGDPVCSCPDGYWGTWCQHNGDGSRTGETNIVSDTNRDIIEIEGVEPRHADDGDDKGNITSDVEENDKSDLKVVSTTVANEVSQDISEVQRQIHKVHESLKEQMGIRAIHSDIFNSGKLIEHFNVGEAGLE